MKTRLTALCLAGLLWYPTVEAKEMKVKITLDQHVRYATLTDNPSTQSLMKRLPLSLPLEDYADSEKIARLPAKLDTAAKPRHRGRPGDITYYAPWGNLALFYGSGPDATGLVYLGRFDGDFEVLKQARNIRIERAD
ncbi:cyclophilin-like fold protein [Pasteurella testudinis]|uniref:cyclophilin-like fold protein n=1 Tax=Pasteurella testudinis TaxID=761 RepID=UPI00405A35D2